MTEQIRKVLSDSKAARWGALLVVSFTMFAGYYLADVLAPLQGLLENQIGWNGEEYGFVTSAYGWFNVFLGFLIIGGIILDKMGIRFTGVASSAIMVAGTALKYWAVQTHSLDGINWHILFWDVKAQVMMAALGYAIFGVGVEVAGITVSKIIVKWFKGKEMALAMGLQLSIARLGTALAISTSLPLALYFRDVSMPILFCLIMLCIGLIAFIIYTFSDKKLDASIATHNELHNIAAEEEFRMKDILKIITNKGWWYIAILCVLFYSAVFPFLKYATSLMVNKFGVDEYWAGLIPSLLPYGTILFTPLFGGIYDKKGKGATIMIIGALLIIFVHAMFSIPFLNSYLLAILLVLVLGVGFSLVPSAMWPSVPKIVPDRQLGTAFSLIFWVQNWGLMGVPDLIGWVLNKYCFVGYVAILGAGFITQQGDMVPKAIVNNKVVEINAPTMLTRNDSTYTISGFSHNQKTEIVSVYTLGNDTIPKGLIPNSNFSGIDKFDLPVFTVEKKNVDAFITSKGERISKYTKVSPLYNYTLPMMIFAGFGLLALLFAFLLKIEDKKKGYGLESPNIIE